MNIQWKTWHDIHLDTHSDNTIGTKSPAILIVINELWESHGVAHLVLWLICCEGKIHTFYVILKFDNLLQITDKGWSIQSFMWYIWMLLHCGPIQDDTAYISEQTGAKYE